MNSLGITTTLKKENLIYDTNRKNSIIILFIDCITLFKLFLVSIRSDEVLLNISMSSLK